MGFQYKIKYFFIRKFAKLCINTLLFTCQVKIENLENIKELKKTGVPIIYVFWHRHIFFNVFRFKNSAARPLISLSTDGEIISQIAQEFGMNPVRGSSSKGGARAFLGLLNSIKEEKPEILITADGPKGPLREIKEGTVILAHKTGAAVVPVAWFSNRVKILTRSWDQFIVPLPFGSITFAYGDPIFIAKKPTRDRIEETKLKIKNQLDDLEKWVEGKYG